MSEYERYFERWNCVMHYPNPGRNDRTSPNPVHGYTGNASVIPAFEHKTCGGLVAAFQNTPPKVCPVCNADTEKEQNEIDKSEVSPGGVILSG